MSSPVFRLAALAAAAIPAALAGQVVINEIQYHPRSDLVEDEFIELYNSGPAAVALGGWAFTEGVSFTFPAGASIPSGGYLVVARDAERLRSRYALDPGAVLGNYGGALSNGGERLVLADAGGRPVDRVEFGDEFPWPAEADGGGPSLECVDPRQDNSTPQNWLASGNRSSWRPVEVEGPAASNLLYLYLEGAGECLVDDVSVRESGSSAELFPEGDFEGGADGWTMGGTHAQSGITASEAHRGNASLHLIATGPGGGAGTSVTRAIAAVVPGRVYSLSFWAKPLSGNSSLISRVSGGGIIARTDLRRLEGTPGRENSVRSGNLPPLIADFSMDPPLPAPGKPARLLAAIIDEDLLEAGGSYDLGDGPRQLTLLDDGSAGDAVAGDGVFTGEIPGAPRGSIVDFRVFASDRGGNRAESPVRRYPVSDFDVTSNLPVYHLFIRPADWQRLNADIWTEQYFPAVFVHDGEVFDDAGLRFRGGRPRLFRKKSLKVALSDRHQFQGHDRLNLNAASMDDDYLTEPLAYWFYERCGLEASRTRFVRVELNGSFWGLFIDVEQVDRGYLRRVGLDPEGALYKSVGIVGSLRKLEGVTYNGQQYTYPSQYEKKTREEEPYSDLIGFINGLYTTPPQAMEAYLDANLDVEQYVNYLAASNVMCIWDNIQHNFYFYRDTNGSGKWRVLPWDLDHAWGEWEWQYYYDDTYHLLMGTEAHPFAGVWYTWNRLWTVLLGVPRYRDLYQNRVRELLNTRFAEGPLFRRIDELRAEIAATALLDEAAWPDSQEPLHTGPRRTMAQEIPLLEQNVTRRRQHLARALGVTLRNVPAQPRFRRGDANGDGSVDVSDPLALVFHLFLGGNDLNCADGADADDSGSLTVSDAIAILGHLFIAGPPLAPPGSAACGDDPAADGLECDYSACN